MDTSSFINLFTVVALMTIMLSMGLQVRIQDVLLSARRFRLVALGIVANYMLVPMVTVVLLRLFQANSFVAAGFLILAVCPGAPVGPPITKVAKGDAAMALALMIILTVVSTIVSPALLTASLSQVSSGITLKIDYRAIVRTLLIAQLLPLGIGLGVVHWAPRLTRHIVKPVAILATCFAIVLIGLILAVQYDTLAAIRLRGWIGMTLLLAASLVIGWLCGGKNSADRKTMAVTAASRNVAVGLVIANANFAGTPVVTAVVAYGLFSTVGAIGYAWVTRASASCHLHDTVNGRT